MKVIFLLAFALIPASGQITTMTWGAQANYSNQFTGINGWVNNGRYTSGDTTRSCWAADGTSFLTGNDGFGPQDILGFGTGSAIFLTTMGVYTNPAAGVLNTLVNAMTDYGHSSEDVYGNGTTLKTGGLDCQSFALYWVTYQQFSFSNPSWGFRANILKSLDGGATWCNPAHTNHTTGACTITPSTTGDIPTVTDTMFGDTIRSLQFMSYCQDGTINCPNVDRNTEFKYVLLATQQNEHGYLGRVLLTDLPKLDGTLYQYYKGGDWLLDASWGILSDATPIEPSEWTNQVGDFTPPIYIASTHRYVTLVGYTFYQGPTLAGPWTSLLAFPTSGLPTHEGWYGPVLKSLATIGRVTTITYNSTWSPAEFDGSNKQLNQYNPVFHLATFTSGTTGIFPMPGGVRVP